MRVPQALARAPAEPPLTWTAAWVRGRLVEAYDVDARLPRARARNGGAGSWPPIVHTFADVVGWSDRGTRRRVQGALAFEVSRMEEAFGWFAILARHPGERHCLEAWARCTGSLSRELERRGWSRTTFYRRVEDGSQRIADVLNQRGVMVR